MKHQNVINSKAGNYIRSIAGIRTVQHSVISSRPSKIIHAFPCQPVISGNHISIKNLTSGIHGILKLFIEWTVFIGFMHAAFQSSQADIPDWSQAFIGSCHLCLYLQRITGFQIIKACYFQRLFSCLDFQPDKTVRTEPERFISFLLPFPSVSCHMIGICKTMKVTVFPVAPVSFFRQVSKTSASIFLLDIAFCGQDFNKGFCSIFHPE